MKRYIYTLLACACVLFGFVVKAEAQIQDGDIITICSGNNYLAVNRNGNSISIANVATTPTVNCLWKVTITGTGNNTQYAFQSVADESYGLRGGNNNLSLSNTGSYFTFDGNDTGASVQGTLRCNSNKRYIRYNNSWTTNRQQGSNLTLEKWELREEVGGLKGVFAPNEIEAFGLAESDTRDIRTVEFTVSRTPSKRYYQCLAADKKIILEEGEEDDSPIEFYREVSFRWKNGQTTAYASCANYENAAVTNRPLLQVSSTETTTDLSKQERIWSVTITAPGSSPMEMKDGDGKWMDYQDELIATFTTADRLNTYKVSVPITRKSYHREVLPEFVANADHESIVMKKVAGTASVNIYCEHQHGVAIYHYSYEYDGATEVKTEVKKIYDAEPIVITDLSFASFAPKSVIDETNVDWLTLSHTTNGPTDGKLILTATENTTASARVARLLGTFKYTCPTNPSVVHTAFLQIPVTQNAKDGAVKFIPQKGHYNSQFGKNPYTNADEQMVHTAERTIYYLPDESITLTVAEKAFRGYKRWYDYQTGDDPRYNAQESDRTTWNTVPQGALIGAVDDYGNTYGMYDVATNDVTMPVIKGWDDGKTHIIACDLSNYTDYVVEKDGNQLVSVTEPTLSYRQLFNLRPASEMADKIAALKDGEFLENYTYTAPTGTTIYLSTEFRYNSNVASDNCYFYYKEGIATRVTDVTWTGTGTTSGAFRQVSSTTEGTQTYELTANDGKVRIAKFTVKYVNKNTYGPSTTEIISREEILTDYVLLEEINFNYDPLPSSSVNQQLYRPLPWGESTYGYFYPSGLDGLKYYEHSNRSGNKIPYYGEYMLVNELDLAWADQTNHGGANTGYVLYVDGTTEPGLVASISTDAVVCSGQTMYCSIWLCNPMRSSHSGSNPIFRCNIQGRNDGDGDKWTDVGVYFVGELPKGTNNAGGSWHQVNFPILSEVNYDETRVQIYNFGAGGTGNDFMVDDITLYVSPLPLAAYHATTGCTSYSNTATTNTVVVLRIDYDQLHEDQTDKYVYYHIYDVTDSTTVALKEKVKVGGEYVYQSIYYNEAGLVNQAGVLSIDTVGSIKIPKTKDGSGIVKKTSINEFIAELTPGEHETSKSGKCFIEDATTGKWFLYLVHVIPNEDGESGEEGVHLDREKTYSLRIANAYEDLYRAACVFTTELHAAQDTYIELRNDKVDALRITGCMDDLCANNHHILVVKVENTITPTTGGALQTISALVHADWLVGIENDDIYCSKYSIVASQRTTADEAFKSFYGYSRDEIEDAIIAMRNTDITNVNRKVSNPNELQVITGFTQAQLNLIKDLCNKGLMKLYQTSEMFYLGSEAVARYWVYPVAEDAVVTVNGKSYTLTDCNEPKWVRVKSSHSEYAVNLSPLNKDDQSAQQRLDLPTIRIVEGTTKVAIPVKELTSSTKLNSSLSPALDTVRFNFNEPIEHVLEYVDLSNNRIDVVAAPSALVGGEEYLMRMAFYDEEGHAYINGDPNECRVGYIYFYLSIVPKTVQWLGSASPYWDEDANWKGVKADGTLMDVGFVPLPGSNVIIKKLDVSKPYPVVREDNNHPMDVYYVPNVCKNIYFEAGAMIHNQHLLEYEKAFVDMKIEAANWNAMAAPLKGMYTGDMFVPHDNLLSAGGKSTEYTDVTGTNGHSDYPFVVKPFEGTRTSKAPYVFWQSLYNKRVSIYHENGNQSIPELTNTTVFAQTNSLSQALPVGSGFQVLGFGPNRNSYSNESTEDIIVRLPKPDTKYNYYYKDGSVSDQVAYVEHSSKLAFEPNAAGNMPITLTNEIASNQFMFGNPTMAYIDMEKFLKANESVLAQKYYSMENSAWSAENMFTIAHNPGTGLLAPMRSVMLELKEGSSASKSLKVTLSTKHLAGAEGSVPASAPRKRMAAATENATQLMTIYATSEGGQARCVLAANEDSKNSYDSAEDVLFVSSGVETDVNSATATTPVNMYTVSEQVPMMVDVRETIERVPLSLLVHPDYRTAKMQLAFYLSMNWNKECYLHDVKTGERYRILDGLWLELEMPSNHEERYYIEGPDESEQGGGPATELPEVEEVLEGKDVRVWAYSPEQGTLQVGTDDVIREVAVYDVLGRRVKHQKLSLYYPTVSLHLPSGACIVEVTLRDNSKRYTQAIVR